MHVTCANPSCIKQHLEKGKRAQTGQDSDARGNASPQSVFSSGGIVPTPQVRRKRGPKRLGNGINHGSIWQPWIWSARSMRQCEMCHFWGLWNHLWRKGDSEIVIQKCHGCPIASPPLGNCVLHSPSQLLVYIVVIRDSRFLITFWSEQQGEVGHAQGSHKLPIFNSGSFYCVSISSHSLSSFLHILFRESSGVIESHSCLAQQAQKSIIIEGFGHFARLSQRHQKANLLERAMERERESEFSRLGFDKFASGSFALFPRGCCRGSRDPFGHLWHFMPADRPRSEPATLAVAIGGKARQVRIEKCTKFTSRSSATGYLTLVAEPGGPAWLARSADRAGDQDLRGRPLRERWPRLRPLSKYILEDHDTLFLALLAAAWGALHPGHRPRPF